MKSESTFRNQNHDTINESATSIELEERVSQFLTSIDKRIPAHQHQQIEKIALFLLNNFSDLALQSLPFAENMVRFRAEPDLIAAALIFPLMDKNAITLSEKKHLYDPATTLARELHHILATFPPQSLPKSDPTKLFELFSNHIQLAVLTLGWHLTRLESASQKERDSWEPYAQEVLNVFVPIADRMGMGALRSALEDRCFQLLQPEQYDQLAQQLDSSFSEDHKVLEIFEKGIRSLLRQHGFRAQIVARTKGMYSLYRKMQQTQSTPEQILDRLGIRILLPSQKQCYRALHLLHQQFLPIPGTFDDYIASPKVNGYQSLHTCVQLVEEMPSKVIEIQIRTNQMHYEAEFGIAAHWRYKKSRRAQRERDLIQKAWLAAMSKQWKKVDSYDEFVELLSQKVFGKTITIQDERGKKYRVTGGTSVQELFEEYFGKNAPKWIMVNSHQVNSEYILAEGDTVHLRSVDR